MDKDRKRDIRYAVRDALEQFFGISSVMRRRIRDRIHGIPTSADLNYVEKLKKDIYKFLGEEK